VGKRRSGGAPVQAHRFVRQLGLIAAADQQAPGTVALAVAGERRAEALRQ
jgi:hypothetical protein